MSRIATPPPSVIVAGIERSTLPGPEAITNIWPIATRTKNTEKERPATSVAAAPCPEATTTVTSQTARAPSQAKPHSRTPQRCSALTPWPPAGRARP
jgi:hypothetical protein